MTEFWEANFIEKQTMWGEEPSASTIVAKDFLIEHHTKNLLLPGIGYGRNAKVFLDNGIDVVGIEISKTAIELARTKMQLNIPIYHGSVADMPFDNKLYDGIYSYALIHLLNSRERQKFIKDCYNQLQPGGYMIFSTISKKDSMYGKGREISKDRFHMSSGANLFFYDADAIQHAFGKYGLVSFSGIEEPTRPGQPPM